MKSMLFIEKYFTMRETFVFTSVVIDIDNIQFSMFFQTKTLDNIALAILIALIIINMGGGVDNLRENPLSKAQ